jgi:hypothetical protein
MLKVKKEEVEGVKVLHHRIDFHHPRGKTHHRPCP